MQVEQHDEADHHPHVQDQIDAAADPDQRRQAACLRGKPHEIKPGQRGEHGHQPDHGCPAILTPSIKQNAAEEAR